MLTEWIVRTLVYSSIVSLDCCVAAVISGGTVVSWLGIGLSFAILTSCARNRESDSDGAVIAFRTSDREFYASRTVISFFANYHLLRVSIIGRAEMARWTVNTICFQFCSIFEVISTCRAILYFLKFCGAVVRPIKVRRIASLNLRVGTVIPCRAVFACLLSNLIVVYCSTIASNWVFRLFWAIIPDWTEAVTRILAIRASCTEISWVTVSRSLC
jgi:hypothetical protein